MGKGTGQTLPIRSGLHGETINPMQSDPDYYGPGDLCINTEAEVDAGGWKDTYSSDDDVPEEHDSVPERNWDGRKNENVRIPLDERFRT